MEVWLCRYVVLTWSQEMAAYQNVSVFVCMHWVLSVTHSQYCTTCTQYRRFVHSLSLYIWLWWQIFLGASRLCKYGALHHLYCLQTSLPYYIRTLHIQHTFMCSKRSCCTVVTFSLSERLWGPKQRHHAMPCLLSTCPCCSSQSSFLFQVWLKLATSIVVLCGVELWSL